MDGNDGWLTLEETAGYLGMGKTALYALAREGRISAKKIGKKWAFEQSSLNAWVHSNQPMEAYFNTLNFNIDDNDLLREPQNRLSAGDGAGQCTWLPAWIGCSNRLQQPERADHRGQTDRRKADQRGAVRARETLTQTEQQRPEPGRDDSDAAERAADRPVMRTPKEPRCGGAGR